MLRLLLHLFILNRLYSLTNGVLIDLPNGTIRGKESMTSNNKTYYSFLKVPYAAPPVGNLRFKAPVPPENWDGLLDATSNSAVCFQINRESPLETEDCLHLNVYTPELPSELVSPALPVLFFIHGGGFIQGACIVPLCGPKFLIDLDIIVVTIHYRLGPFGFLSTEDAIIPGNNGLKDQQLALKFVHENIHLFGGDRSKITINGQSAGAASVGYHFLNKQSEGLFRGGILESGSPLSPWAFQRRARELAFKTAGYINANFNQLDDSRQLLEFLLQVSAKEIDEASFKIFQLEMPENRQLSQGFFYAPVLEPEHDGAFITRRMYDDLENGNFFKVPILIGIASEESINEATDLEIFEQNMRSYDDNLEWIVPDDMNINNNLKRKLAGSVIRNLYTKGGKFADNLGAGVRYLSDTSFTRSVIKHADLQSKFTDVFFYQFSYDGAIGNLSVFVDGAETVYHTEENAYLWNVVFEGFDNSDISQFPAKDILTHNRLLKIFTDFVKFLNPTPQPSDLLHNLIWPTVSPENGFLYVDINENLEIKNWPKAETYIGWKMIYNIFGQCPFDTY